MLPEGRWLEFLLAAVIALVVVGPKDLPVLLRRLGQFMARVRAMASEFRASFDEMARQSELDELRKEVEQMRKAQAGDLAALAGSPEVQQTFNDLSQGLTDVGVNLDSPTSYPYVMAQTEHVEALPEPAPKPARKSATKTPAKSATPAKRAAKAAPAKAASKPAAKPRARKPVPEAEPIVAPARRRKSGGTVT